MQDNSTTEIAWMAGLFEGEGSIAFTTKTGVQLVLAMNDRDVVERFMALCGCGAIYSYPRKKDKHGTSFRWVVSERHGAERILRAMLPWLGARRSARAVAALERLQQNPGARRYRTHCPHGHEYNVSNVVMDDGSRKCRICLRQRYDARNLVRRKERQATSPA